MSFFLFIDESGQDRRESPYPVLAGFAIEDKDLWNFILSLRSAEDQHFGMRYTAGAGELKARKLLKRKTFRLAEQMEPIPFGERAELARGCLLNGGQTSRAELTALAQAKLAYVHEVLDIAARFRCRAFATIVNPASPDVSAGEHLRKDYSYLFERFFYFLEDSNRDAMGVIIFDELEASKSIRLSEQMHRYFLRTDKGRLRSSQIIPEPLFVHSEMTSGVQVADLIAYIVSWGLRFGPMDLPARTELTPYVEQVNALRYRTTREIGGEQAFVVWSLCWIDDLRAQEEAPDDAEG